MQHQVMIVDDDLAIRDTVKRILERHNILVVAVSSGNECLEKLREGFKGLILMDVVMPEMDGWDTIKKIVEEGLLKGVLISMLTGKEVPDKRLDGLKEYVLDYIRKPFDYQAFLEIVKEYLSYL